MGYHQSPTTLPVTSNSRCFTIYCLFQNLASKLQIIPALYMHYSKQFSSNKNTKHFSNVAKVITIHTDELHLKYKYYICLQHQHIIISCPIWKINIFNDSFIRISYLQTEQPPKEGVPFWQICSVARETLDSLLKLSVCFTFTMFRKNKKTECSQQ